MKTISGCLLLLTGSILFLGPRPVWGQACQDDEEMLKVSIKDVSDLVDTVKKENVSDFQNHYHQKSYVSKMTFLLRTTGGLIDCLNKAAQDTTATKEQVDAYKVKRDAYAKFKARLEQDEGTIKSTEDAKNAKGLIEKCNLST
jgi:hypothetical protein